MEIVQYTKLSAKDYQRLFGYHREHILLNFPDSQFRQNLFKTKLQHDLQNPHAALFFAKDEETHEVIGFLWLRREEDPYKDPKPYHYLDLHYIQVDPAWRQKGIGSKLITFVVEYAKNHQCKEVRLGTHAQNTHAQHLYEKFGFEEYRVIMRKLL